MKKKNISSVLIIIAGALTAFALKTFFFAPEVGVPEIAFTEVDVKQQLIDVGEIKSGKEIMATFELVNSGKEDLVISETRPDCHCTVPKVSAETATQGEEIKVNVKYEKNDIPGYFQQNVLVYCNIKEVYVVLTIRGKIV